MSTQGLWQVSKSSTVTSHSLGSPFPHALLSGRTAAMEHQALGWAACTCSLPQASPLTLLAQLPAPDDERGQCRPGPRGSLRSRSAVSLEHLSKTSSGRCSLESSLTPLFPVPSFLWTDPHCHAWEEFCYLEFMCTVCPADPWCVLYLAVRLLHLQQESPCSTSGNPQEAHRPLKSIGCANRFCRAFNEVQTYQNLLPAGVS